MNYFILSFNQLNIKQLFEIYKLRSQVFVVEQNCAYQDVDEKDLLAMHVLIYKKETLVSYARIIPPNISYLEPCIGRVVVNPDYRNKRYGFDLMEYCIKQSLSLYKNQTIVISAQLYLLKFYTDLGFVQQVESYLEDNIPHIKMLYSV